VILSAREKADSSAAVSILLPSHSVNIPFRFFTCGKGNHGTDSDTRSERYGGSTGALGFVPFIGKP
jgi:hypothetical protein